MKRTRVVQVIPDLGVGGAERMLVHLATGLDRARYEVAVVSFYDPCGSAIEADLARGGIELVHLGKTVGFDVRMFGRLAGALRRLGAGVVHTHRAVLHYLLPSLMGPLRKRTAHTVHNLAEHEVPGVVRLAHRLAFRVGVAPVAIGDLVAESIVRVYGMPPRAVIPHGIPVARFAAPSVARGAWRAANGVPAGATALACVCRLSAQKNVGALLEAFGRLGDLDAVLLVAGDGPLRSTLEAAGRDLGIAGRVRFLGARSDVPDLLGATDVCVLPSLWEGNPLAILEAMAAGVPVVATRVGGVPEFVRDGETGSLVPPGDVGALEVALRRIVTDAAFRRALGSGARRVAVERFDVARMVSDYERLYEALLRADARKAPALG